MSLLKWKELAKRKSELGDRINSVHDAITKHDVGQQTSQESLAKVFQPVTTKLDDVITSNLRLPSGKRRPLKKWETPDYGISIDDEIGDMNIGDLFDEPVLPQQDKQIVPKPPTYEESLQDLLEGKKDIYVDPQYFPEEPNGLPPEYDDNEEIDYALDDEDATNEILNDIGIINYDSIENVLTQPEMTHQKTRKYLLKVLKDAKTRRNQLKGYKSNVTKEYNSGTISGAERQIRNKRIDNARGVLNEYIKHYEGKVQTMEGSGIRGSKRGGSIMFYNNVKQLLKKLELIIGEIMAGNTSIDMRNMGVAILDTLLKAAIINRSQYQKIYMNYFK